MKIAYISAEATSKRLDKYLRELRSNFPGMDIEVVWTGPDLCEKDISFVNENRYLDKDKFIEEWRGIDRPIWYYQQFLKYSIVEACEFDKTWIVDGDSVINNGELAEEGVIWTTGRSCHPGYIKIIKNYLNVSSLQSYVTNQMIFSKYYLKKMFIEKFRVSNTQEFISLIHDNLLRNKEIEFSEYQTYGEYVATESVARVKNLKIFRRMDLIPDQLRRQKRKYDVVAFENHASGVLRKIRAIFYYLCSRSLG